jgi:hypothetical protein
MPRIAHVSNLVPADPPDVCELAVFPVAVVPFALGALEYRIPKYVWADDSYARGVQLIRSLQMAILCGGMKELIESQDRMYRMLGTAIYGTVYEVVATDPELIVTPIIEPTHLLEIENDESILGRMELMKQLLENGINGTATPNYDRENGIRDLLELIKAAIEAESDIDADMLAKLAEIALALV